MRYLWYSLAACLIFFVGGFVLFIQYIVHIPIPANPSINAIVVLTGEPNRIEKAFELLENKIGQRVFISGVHHSVSKDILLQKIPIRKDLAECCVDIGYKALNTAGNAKEALEWIRKHDYHHVLIITHDYHIPRILLELHRNNSMTKFIPYPIITHDLQKNTLILYMKMLRMTFIEYLKILLLSLQIVS
ncbi:YdcF family protein [Candidatus Liberibacter solanacearum]|uniref:YdcF family protein n=1 Tax=Candidatus Liberibacter solanacearum TaxID=556287 RepID=A0A424FNW6_9HYPH|nr:YdcF family protein [Candidatus Liberibacter solanacearum]